MAQYFHATGIIIIIINQCVILIVLKVRVKTIILNHKKKSSIGKGGAPGSTVLADELLEVDGCWETEDQFLRGEYW